MIARGFKPVAWVAAVGAAALGCYMLSLRVAAERAELTGLELKIVSAERSIRSLQTELGTRGRVTQLQQWNEEILALSPPEAGQFLESQMVLARFDMRRPVLSDQAEVRMASAEVPATTPAPAAPAAAPQPQRAVAGARPAESPPARAVVQRASLTVQPATRPGQSAARPAATRLDAPPARTRTAVAETPPRQRGAETRPATTPQRTRTASADPAPRSVGSRQPARPRALLDERTVRDLGSTSRAERRGGTRD